MLFLILILIAPLNVFASSKVKNVGIYNNGSATETLYVDSKSYNYDFLTRRDNFGGLGFSRHEYEDYSPMSQYSYRLTWNLNSSIFTGFDTVSFTVGMKGGYFNSGRLLVRASDGSYSSGWINCSPSSLPGNELYSTYFTTFSCSFDSSAIIDNTDYTLYFSSYSVASYYDPDGLLQTFAPSSFMSIDAIFSNNSDNSIINSLNTNTESLNNQIKAQEDTNNKLDEITEMQPTVYDTNDSSSFDSYEDGEKQLLDSVKDVDLDSLSIGIDSDSSSFVWNTLTSFIQSHPAVFGMFIAVLSLGIIKLALGR